MSSGETAGAQPAFQVPPHLERSHDGLRSRAEVVRSAELLLAELADALGVGDLGGLRFLDIGCGIKFTRALLTEGMAIGHYFGVDVYAPLIEFFQEAVTDDRFGYAHFDVYNERYNPTGRPLVEMDRFPVDDGRFDVCLGYSLFTHLDPPDSRLTLTNMHRATVPGGRAVFTAFLDEHSETEFGWVDSYSKALGGSVEGIAKGTYIDVFDDDPLRVAMYDREYLVGILAETGWDLIEVRPPSEFAQHTVVARAQPEG